MFELVENLLQTTDFSLPKIPFIPITPSPPPSSHPLGTYGEAWCRKEEEGLKGRRTAPG